MSNGKNRVLGRVLAVEETRYISGAQSLDRDIDIGTDIQSDVSDPIGESNTCSDSIFCNGSTDIAPDPVPTDPLLDCNSSTSRRDICIDPA